MAVQATRRAVLAALGLTLVGRAGCASGGTGEADPAPSGRPARWRWTVPDAAADAEFPRGLTVAGSVLYAGHDGHLSALDAPTGHLRWTSDHGPDDHSPTGGERWCPPVVGAGLVYVLRNTADGSHGIEALDPAGGTVRWSFTATDGSLSPPVLAGDLLCAASDLTVYGLDPATGRPRWRYQDPQGGPLTRGTPAVGSGIVAVANTTVLRGIDAATGHLRWSRTGSFASLDAVALVHAGGVLYTGSAAFDARTGADRWSGGIDTKQLPVVVAGGHVYATDTSQPGALDAATGRTRWSFPAPGDGTPLGPVAVLGGKVFLGTRQSGPA